MFGGIATVGKMAELGRDDRFFKACADGDIYTIKSIVAPRGVHPNPYWTYYYCAESPLHVACR